MEHTIPKGFRMAGVHSGVKSKPEKQDLSLFVSDRPCVASGVFTQNIVHGAPVRLNRERTPGESIRGVVVNSGVANACTGEQGYRDTVEMARLTGEAIGCDAADVLVMSTGIIGTMLPMEKIAAGIQDASKQLSDSPDALTAAARGMMTTDTVHKVRSKEFEADGVQTRITGVTKGAAMIGPNMATMLGVVMTDACLTVEDAAELIRDAADESFNCISVDGHTSTSDTVLLLANGAASSGSQPLADRGLAQFRATLVEVCEDLAQSIPADGEGASHLITVEVHGCRTRGDAVTIARTVADSPLVKTAVAGADPNWGRIVSAAGYAGVPFDPKGVCLYLNEHLLYERGAPVPFDEQAVSESIAQNRDTSIVLLIGEGGDSARFWTTDLTAEYVRLNADYTT
ncbi:MAG: bifunctional glutamate N-acetyltransferase/amino-acid acetyltransferase ArgJ [Planctomycetota bacterium]